MDKYIKENVDRLTDTYKLISGVDLTKFRAGTKLKLQSPTGTERCRIMGIPYLQVKLPTKNNPHPAALWVMDVKLKGGILYKVSLLEYGIIPNKGAFGTAELL